jgi:ribosomal protein L7Ae-like RNA K-turn-binding protein
MDKGDINEKIYGMLGLAARKRSVISGWSACESARGCGPGSLMIIAGDCAAGTKEKFVRRAGALNIRHVIYGDRSELGRRIGRGDRSVAIVTEGDIARGICALFGFAAAENGGV